MSKRDDLNIPSWLTNIAIKQVLSTVFIVLLIVIISLLIVQRVEALRTSVLNFFGGTPTATVVSNRTLLTGLQSLGQLVSVRAEVAKADIGVSAHMGGLNLCGHSAFHVAQGAIEAGIDITQVNDDSIRYDEASNTYAITLPPPVITSCRIEYIRQYDRSGGNPTCGIDWDRVRLLANYVAMTEFAQDSLDGGILETAESRTTTVMTSFVSSLTDSEVVIRYAEADGATVLPSSCEPQLPPGWELNAETGDWIRVD
jgi:hypothetical protein